MVFLHEGRKLWAQNALDLTSLAYSPGSLSTKTELKGRRFTSTWSEHYRHVDTR